MFLSGLLGGKGREDLQEEDDLSTVDRIIDRIDAATMLSDRRDACKTLRSLARTFRVQTGAKGMASLIRILDQDRSDLEIINLALETLSEIICEQDTLGEQFTEIFIKDCANVNLLLELMEEYEFSVRWAAIKLLSGLVLHQTKQMQTHVLACPMGISRLMDLLIDSREVIRNDALLMLTQLTKSNANIQKIVAFESAFDRLLDIISSEGFADGGIVVEDSLTIMRNLLHNNISNLNYFKEGPYIARLVDFFHNLNNLSSEWRSGKVSNVLAMYKVVRCLVSPNNPTNVTRSCQASLRKSGLLAVLCDTLMASGVPAHVLWENINTVAEVIRGCPENQAVFKAVEAPSEPPTSAVLILLISMLTEKQPLDLRCAILYCFQCYVNGNAQLQNHYIEQFDTCTETKQLHQGLFSRDPMSDWLASMAISYLIIDNKLLDPVIHEVSLNLKSPNMPNQTRIGYLILLATWLCGSEANVAKFVNSSDNISYLTSELCLPSNEQQEAIVQSLCAITLALCIIFNDDSIDAFNKSTLRTLIANRVGRDTFLEKLSMLAKQPCYTAAVRYPQVVADQTLLDYQFCSQYRGVENMVQKCLDENDVQQLQIDELKRKIKQQEELVLQLRNAHSSMLPEATASSLVPTFNVGVASSSAQPQSGPPVQKVAPVFERNFYDEYQKAKQKIAELEQDAMAKDVRINDLLALIGEQSLQISKCDDKLRALGFPEGAQTFEDSAEEGLDTDFRAISLDENSHPGHPTVIGSQHQAAGVASLSFPPLLQTFTHQPVIGHQQNQILEGTADAAMAGEPQPQHHQQVQLCSVTLAQIVPDTPAIQAITSVVPARLVQTASVSELPQPMAMTVADAQLMQNSPTVAAAAAAAAAAAVSANTTPMVQFYNPAAMFQPVTIAERPILPLSEQPPRPPSSTVSSSAAELSGNRTEEANDGFELVPTPTASDIHQQTNPAVVYPFQHIQACQASMGNVFDNTQPAQYVESFQTPSQIPTQFVPPMVSAPLSQQAQQQMMDSAPSLPPARQLFEAAPPATTNFYPQNNSVSML